MLLAATTAVAAASCPASPRPRISSRSIGPSSRPPLSRSDGCGSPAGLTAPTDASTSRTSSFPVTNCSRTTATTISSRSALTAPTAGNCVQSDHRPTNPATWDAHPDSTISVAADVASTTSGAHGRRPVRSARAPSTSHAIPVTAVITSNGMSPRCHRPASRAQATTAVGTIMTGHRVRRVIRRSVSARLIAISRTASALIGHRAGRSRSTRAGRARRGPRAGTPPRR